MNSKNEKRDALWDLFCKTGLPEAYSYYKSEERKVDGGDQGGGHLPQSD